MKFGYFVLVKLDGDKVIGYSKVFEGVGCVCSFVIYFNGDLYFGVDGVGIYKVVFKL